MLIVNYIIYAISVCYISWLVAIVINSLLMKSKWYDDLSHFNFISSKTINKWLCIDCIKWIIKNSFLKYFNQKIKIEHINADLKELRYQMTIAEISHLIGFIFVSVIALYISLSQSITFSLVIMFFNVLMNLYPSLIQQQNKQRIDNLIERQKKHVNSSRYT